MARKKRKAKVYYNNEIDTWSNDSGEQPYLIPGTEAYNAYQARLKTEELQSDDEPQLESDEDVDEIDSCNVDSNDIFAVSNHKFRRQQSKVRHNDEIQKIVNNGLGYSAKDLSKSDEVYDDGLNEKEYKKAVISNYKKEADKVREIPTVDNNGDGKIDKNDVEMTPGMKHLMKYM